jgi:hypothetical protein
MGVLDAVRERDAGAGGAAAAADRGALNASQVRLHGALLRVVQITIPCPVVSCRVLSCPVVSCRVLSCPVVSCRVLSCPVVSCRVVSCRVQKQVLEALYKGGVSEQLLATQLRSAVEKADVEAALEHAASTGRSKEAVEVRACTV